MNEDKQTKFIDNIINSSLHSQKYLNYTYIDDHNCEKLQLVMKSLYL
jgi:hypothetical protein